MTKATRVKIALGYCESAQLYLQNRVKQALDAPSAVLSDDTFHKNDLQAEVGSTRRVS